MVRATGSVQGGHPPARPERLSMTVATLLNAKGAIAVIVPSLCRGRRAQATRPAAISGQQPHRPVRRGL